VNRHVPRSHIAGDPKKDKVCANGHCSNAIGLQPVHRREQADKSHIRYFNDNFQEICHECVAKEFGAEHVSATAHNHPAMS
jgi:hypothetical protein